MRHFFAGSSAMVSRRTSGAGASSSQHRSPVLAPNRSHKTIRKSGYNTAANVSPIRGAGPELPLQEVALIKKEKGRAEEEKEFLLASNAIKKASLRDTVSQADFLKMGNAAVHRAINRMQEETASQLQAHLASKHTIQQLCESNENDMNLIKEFERNNALIGKQKALE